MFGLKEAPVAQFVREVSHGDFDLDRDAIADRFARGVMTGLAEPGDVVAGVMVRSLGAAATLESIVEHRSADRLRADLRDHGVAIDEADVDGALARWAPRLTSASAMLAFRQATRCGARLMVPADDDWPAGVDDLDNHAPVALWRRGRDAALHATSASIALVGARAATGYGEHVTMESAAGLVDRGYAIVSGAAYGIDGMAHRAALASHGFTVAVLAGGVDRFYPSGHDALLTRITEAGAVVSELPCGASPTKWRFLQRNRLIAALTQATVVLEAGWRSGSLNTAGHASTLGRPLGAVPGPVTSAASAGCHRLIREYDAVCVTNADEMAELAPIDQLPVRADVPQPSRPPADHVRVLDAMSDRSARNVDDIAGRAGLAIADVQSSLGALELSGSVTQRDRGWVRSRA